MAAPKAPPLLRPQATVMLSRVAHSLYWMSRYIERAENLEQLRALEHGVPIGVIVVRRGSVGVDVPGDLAKAARALRKS